MGGYTVRFMSHTFNLANFSLEFPIKNINNNKLAVPSLVNICIHHFYLRCMKVWLYPINVITFPPLSYQWTACSAWRQRTLWNDWIAPSPPSGGNPTPICMAVSRSGYPVQRCVSCIAVSGSSYLQKSGSASRGHSGRTSPSVIFSSRHKRGDPYIKTPY